MTNSIIKKLQAYAPLTEEEKSLLDKIVGSHRPVAAGTQIARRGEEPKFIRLVLSGLLCRYKQIDDRKRQILAYMVPGDFCDLYGFILDAMDHSLMAMVDSTIVDISPQIVEELTAQPNIGRALWWATLVDGSILREWIVNLGVRSAEKRIGHFLCEMMLRLRLVDLADENQFVLPLTQTDLAESLGLSLVHTNKSLHNLRSDGLVTFQKSLVSIPDFDRLAKFSSFDSQYLHLGSRASVHQETFKEVDLNRTHQRGATNKGRQ